MPKDCRTSEAQILTLEFMEGYENNHFRNLHSGGRDSELGMRERGEESSDIDLSPLARGHRRRRRRRVAAEADLPQHLLVGRPPRRRLVEAAAARPRLAGLQQRLEPVEGRGRGPAGARRRLQAQGVRQGHAAVLAHLPPADGAHRRVGQRGGAPALGRLGAGRPVLARLEDVALQALWTVTLFRSLRRGAERSRGESL